QRSAPGPYGRRLRRRSAACHSSRAPAYARGSRLCELRTVISFDDDEVDIGRIAANLDGVPVFRRLVAGPRRFEISEFDHDIPVASLTRHHLAPAATGQEATAELAKRSGIGLDIFPVAIRIANRDPRDPVSLRHS